MVGNLGEWIAEKNQHKNITLKDAETPAWFWYLPVFNYTLRLNFPHYVGFRPVRDKWDQEVWQGVEVKKG